MAKTRLDKVVKYRERAEDDALAGLARAQRGVQEARERLADAEAAARQDRRAPGRAALWELEDSAHRRALQAVRARQGEVGKAEQARDSASSGYREARQDAEAMRRAADRKRAEESEQRERGERRATDEAATQRFNRK